MIINLTEPYRVQGFFVVVLDPLEEIPDVDRLDNVFVQYVEFEDSVEFTPTCNVIGLGSAHGNQQNYQPIDRLTLRLSSLFRPESSDIFQRY